MKVKRCIIYITISFSIVSLIVSIILFFNKENCQTYELLYDISVNLFGGGLLGFLIAFIEYNHEKEVNLNEFILKTNKICQDLLPITYFFRDGDYITDDTLSMLDEVKNSYNANEIFIKQFAFLCPINSKSMTLINKINTIQKLLSEMYAEIFIIVNELYKCKLRNLPKHNAEQLLRRFLNETFLIEDKNCLVVKIDELNNEIKKACRISYKTTINIDIPYTKEDK